MCAMRIQLRITEITEGLTCLSSKITHTKLCIQKHPVLNDNFVIPGRLLIKSSFAERTAEAQFSRVFKMN